MTLARLFADADADAAAFAALLEAVGMDDATFAAQLAALEPDPAQLAALLEEMADNGRFWRVLEDLSATSDLPET